VVQQSPGIQAVIPFFGEEDLRQGVSPTRVANTTNFLGTAPTNNPALAALASPVTLAKRGAPPYLLLHGELDTDVPPASQDIPMQTALRASGVAATYVPQPGFGHGFPVPLSGDPNFRTATCTALAFLHPFL
jgi:dipeptidyl aminopeptidase/acylaminoacyl peptidase